MGLMGVPLVRDHADYRLMTRQALEALLSYSEANLFLRGIVTEIGFSTAQVPYKRPARHAGASSYTLAKMLGLAFAGITSFTSMPLRAIAVLGLVSAFVSAGLGLWVLWLALFHHDHIVPGWASTVVPMSLFTTVQLISMAIIGEYLARMYTETKRRPRYHVETVAGSNRPFRPPT
jgi:hypothetical protein